MLPSACFLIAYLLGSAPIGLLVSRMARGIDIRAYGTGNIGASNVFRHLGPVPAIGVGVGCFLQGWGPPSIALWVTRSELCLAAAGIGAVAGYGWSIFTNFRGGSAVGVATGALAALAPWGLVPLLACYGLGGLLRRPAPLVLLGLLADLGFILITPHPPAVMVASAIVVAIVILKRLAGLRRDLRQSPEQATSIVINRLLHDRKLGQQLQGKRGEPT